MNNDNYTIYSPLTYIPNVAVYVIIYNWRWASSDQRI